MFKSMFFKAFRRKLKKLWSKWSKMNNPVSIKAVYCAKWSDQNTMKADISSLYQSIRMNQLNLG